MPTKSCPICAKRRGKRHCPGLARSRWAAKTETICAQCCGEQREATIDCPLDCPYLLAAHRYEAERPTAAPAELAFPQVALDRDFLDEQQRFIAALALFFCRFAAEQKDVRDADLLAALDSLARGYQTLESGLYYEQPPDAVAARAPSPALFGPSPARRCRPRRRRRPRPRRLSSSRAARRWPSSRAAWEPARPLSSSWRTPSAP